MGRAYHANNKSLEDFDVNFAGADLLGLLHKECGKGFIEFKYSDYIRYNTKYEMTKEEAEETAEAILLFIPVLRKRKELKLLDNDITDLWGGTKEDFIKWCKAWAKWLKKSNGYTVPC